MKRYLPVVERESNMIINDLLRNCSWTDIQNMTRAFEGAVMSNNSPLIAIAATELRNTAVFK